MNLLTISDLEMDLLYSPLVKSRFCNVDMIVSCGDLPYFYLDYIQSMLNVPLYYVLGNHANQIEISDHSQLHAPPGGTNLHGRVINHQGFLMAGVEGCIQYNYGPRQYSQNDMWMWVLSLTPYLMMNKLLYGRYLDAFFTHAPAWNIHDMPDRPHQGVKAFRWLIKVFKPQYHFHGHIHVYQSGTITESIFHQTRVVNTYGYRVTDIDICQKTKAPAVRPES